MCVCVCVYVYMFIVFFRWFAPLYFTTLTILQKCNFQLPLSLSIVNMCVDIYYISLVYYTTNYTSIELMYRIL